MKKRRNIIINIIFAVVLVLLLIGTYLYFNKAYNIKKYLEIRVPSTCKFISYKKTSGVIKAMVRANQSELDSMLEDAKEYHGKANDAVTKKECYYRLKDFEIEEERALEMYESMVSRTRLFSTLKTAERYVLVVKGEQEGEYYVCFYAYLFNFF